MKKFVLVLVLLFIFFIASPAEAKEKLPAVVIEAARLTGTPLEQIVPIRAGKDFGLPMFSVDGHFPIYAVVDSKWLPSVNEAFEKNASPEPLCAVQALIEHEKAHILAKNLEDEAIDVEIAALQKCGASRNYINSRRAQLKKLRTNGNPHLALPDGLLANVEGVKFVCDISCDEKLRDLLEVNTSRVFRAARKYFQREEPIPVTIKVTGKGFSRQGNAIEVASLPAPADRDAFAGRLFAEYIAYLCELTGTSPATVDGAKLSSFVLKQFNQN